MADVLIVCVREDEPQAKSLAETFERAGFSVGGAPSTDGALRGCGAVVIVWSQASIRSRPFLDAAQRVVNADKAVLACMIDPPPPSSINNAPAFDLSHWTGDPEDSALDPLYFAVDRMVNANRAAVGAAPSQPAPAQFEPPPSLRPPPNAPPYARSTRAPEPYQQPYQEPPAAPMPPGFQMRRGSQPPAPAPSQRAPLHAPPAPQNDPMGSEAEHWRAIRHSNDPTDFLDYLQRHGPESAFAELAQLRLKTLEGGQSPVAPPTKGLNLHNAARAASVAPAPRRYEAPQPARREREREPVREAREPVRERPNYDPPPVDYKTPKTGGGAIRMLLLLILLGGAGIAGAVYMGYGDQLMAIVSPAAQQQDTTSENVEPLTPVGEPAVPSAEEVTSPSDLQAQGIDELTTNAPPAREERAQPARNTERTAERPAARREEPRESARSVEDTYVPPPVTSWSQSPSSSGGPVSLNPSGAAPPSSGGPVSLVPASPPDAQPASTSPAPAAAPPRGSFVFTRRPTSESIADNFPRQALRDGVNGRVSLDCTVQPNLSLACGIGSETPPRRGFGRAALDASEAYRVRATMSDGASAVGQRVRVRIDFNVPQD